MVYCDFLKQNRSCILFLENLVEIVGEDVSGKFKKFYRCVWSALENVAGDTGVVSRALDAIKYFAEANETDPYIKVGLIDLSVAIKGKFRILSD